MAAKFRNLNAKPLTVMEACIDRPNEVPADVVGYPKPPECNWSLTSYPYPDPALASDEPVEQAEPKPQPHRRRHRPRR